MSPTLEAATPTPHGFPRVSGDEPFLVSEVFLIIAFSPRERG